MASTYMGTCRRDLLKASAPVPRLLVVFRLESQWKVYQQGHHTRSPDGNHAMRESWWSVPTDFPEASAIGPATQLERPVTSSSTTPFRVFDSRFEIHTSRKKQDLSKVSTTAAQVLGKGGASPSFGTSYKMHLWNLNMDRAFNGERYCMSFPAGSLCSVLAPGSCGLCHVRSTKHTAGSCFSRKTAGIRILGRLLGIFPSRRLTSRHSWACTGKQVVCCRGEYWNGLGARDISMA